METLANIINNRYALFMKSYTEIGTSIEELLKELSDSPTKIFTKYREITEPQSAWEIEIINKTVTLTYEQIVSNYNLRKRTNPAFTLKECLTNIIIDKFKW